MTAVYVIFLVVLSFSCSWAANVYVGPSATGNGSGDSWTNTKAASSLTGMGWIRGNTYYFKEGNYGNINFGTANAAATLIYIRKCGTAGQTSNGKGDGICENAPGFIASEHDGKAVFPSWTISSGYWDISGVTGGGPSNFMSGHGFLIEGYSHPLLNMNNYNSDNIYVGHVELNGINRLYGQGSNICYSGGVKSVKDDPSGNYFSGGQGVSNTTFEYMYIHDVTCPAFHTFGMNNVTIQYNAIARIGYSGYEPLPHTEVWSGVNDANVTWRWNWLEDISNTGYFCHVNGGSTINVYIYGNVAYQTGLGTVHASHFVNTGSASTSNWKVYNNTLVGWTSGGPNILFGSGSGNEVKNNIWAHHPAMDNFSCNGAHDYNGYYSMKHWQAPYTDMASSAAGQEAHGQLFTSTPFSNYVEEDFGLKTATSPGVALPSPYNVDMFGIIRGGDGTWDRGAFEFTGNNPPPPDIPPSPPTNLQILSQ